MEVNAMNQEQLVMCSDVISAVDAGDAELLRELLADAEECELPTLREVVYLAWAVIDERCSN
jgi:hypothetical protein